MWPAVALGFPGLMLINATLMHVLPFVLKRGRFSPGLITAVVLFYPAAIAAMRDANLTPGVLVAEFLVGAALLATPIGFILLRDKPYFDQSRP